LQTKAATIAVTVTGKCNHNCIGRPQNSRPWNWNRIKILAYTELDEPRAWITFFF